MRVTTSSPILSCPWLGGKETHGFPVNCGWNTFEDGNRFEDEFLDSTRPSRGYDSANDDFSAKST